MEQLPLKNIQSNSTDNTSNKTKIKNTRDQIAILMNGISRIRNKIEELQIENNKFWQALLSKKPNNHAMTKIIDNHYKTAKLIFRIERLVSELSEKISSFNKLVNENISFFPQVNFNCHDIFEILKSIKAIFSIDLNNFMHKLNSIANLHEDEKLTQTLMKEYILLSLPAYIAFDKNKQSFFNYWFYGESSKAPIEKLEESLKFFSYSEANEENSPATSLNL